MVCRPKADILSLVTEAGMSVSPTEFDAAWALAFEADGSADGHVCLDTFFRARQHLLAQTLEIEGLGSLCL